ncbi:Wall-associated receptor kinase galacturonan-binding domain [Macleaya cordata]|uniref:Wall-associated receptor kinase galacturonan-binding domain n=1 Tax=Macleaya cordata TaxID=56857 RepID=A0A200R1S9_MACCD|nr:Wall-associated receptor kinase galacturonan-binding domain [Macleaya cordata]
MQSSKPPITIFNIILFMIISILQLTKPVCTLPICRNLCGGIAINYPFSIDDGCGAPQYRKMLNCSGDLFFLTPSGNYRVRSIDYEKQTMVIYDPSMSTCSTLQPHHDFILTEIQSVVIPPTSDTIFVLLNCSIDSPVLNHYRSLCFNFSGHSCDELYSSCTSFKLFHPLSGVYPGCCYTSYNTVKLMSMNILDCSHYTTVYNTDDLKGIGPLDWSYGIKLSYMVPNTGCDRCQRTGGTCGFDTETEVMLCVCGSSTNSTRECAGGIVTGGGQKRTPWVFFQVLVLFMGAYNLSI